jgi:hypothetical protein
MAQTKAIRPFDEQDTKLAMGRKTPSQQAKSDSLKSIKKLTKEGKHSDAKALYDETFPRV